MKMFRHRHTATPAVDAEAQTPHPESCPWCGQQRVRGIVSSNEDPQYRCAACGTTFFIHMPTPRPLAQRRPRPESEFRSAWLQPDSVFR